MTDPVIHVETVHHVSVSGGTLALRGSTVIESREGTLVADRLD